MKRARGRGWERYGNFGLYRYKKYFSWYYLRMSMSNWILDLIMYVFYLYFQLTKRLVTSISYHIQTTKNQTNKQKKIPRIFIVTNLRSREKKVQQRSMLTSKSKNHLPLALVLMLGWFFKKKISTSNQIQFQVWYKCLHWMFTILSLSTNCDARDFFEWSNSSSEWKRRRKCKMKNLL